MYGLQLLSSPAARSRRRCRESACQSVRRWATLPYRSLARAVLAVIMASSGTSTSADPGLTGSVATMPQPLHGTSCMMSFRKCRS